jgi:hypothetical protein
MVAQHHREALQPVAAQPDRRIRCRGERKSLPCQGFREGGRGHGAADGCAVAIEGILSG